MSFPKTFALVIVRMNAHLVDKPARLIIRLLFEFASDSETSAVTL